MDALREEVGRLQAANARLALRGTGDGTALDGEQDADADATGRRDRVTWYAAVGGWSVAVLLGLGLIATIARSTPHARDDAESPAPPGRGRSPDSPHRIE
jgi:hypothetical protein